MLRITIEKVEAMVTNVNIRVEKHGPDEKRAGVDIDFNMVVPAKWLNKLGVDSKIDWAGELFEKNGEIKESGVERLTFSRTYEEHGLIIQMDNVSKDQIEMDDITIKKISAKPEFGKKMKVHLQAQCHPSDDAFLFIRDALEKDQILLSVKEPPQQDMLDDSNVVSI